MTFNFDLDPEHSLDGDAPEAIALMFGEERDN